MNEIYVIDGYDMFFTSKDELERYMYDHDICEDEVTTYYRYTEKKVDSPPFL